MADFTLDILDDILAQTPEPPAIAIETGTWKGDTTAILAERFAAVHTLDIDPVFVSLARQRFGYGGTVHAWQGDSADTLPRMLADLDSPAFLYLDAHWWPEVCDDARSPFPLWAEIEAVKACSWVRVVVVDDVNCMGRELDRNTAWKAATQSAILAAMGDRVERWAVIGDGLVTWWKGGEG